MPSTGIYSIHSMNPSHGGLALEIVVPVFNEESVLDKSIRELANYLKLEMPTTWQITIADNASTGNTYRLLPHVWLRLSPTGFKAIRADVARKLLPHVEDAVYLRLVRRVTDLEQYAWVHPSELHQLDHDPRLPRTHLCGGKP